MSVVLSLVKNMRDMVEAVRPKLILKELPPPILGENLKRVYGEGVHAQIFSGNLLERVRETISGVSENITKKQEEMPANEHNEMEKKQKKFTLRS